MLYFIIPFLYFFYLFIWLECVLLRYTKTGRYSLKTGSIEKTLETEIRLRLIKKLTNNKFLWLNIREKLLFELKKGNQI